MSSAGFAYPHLFGKNVPPPAPRWAGNAKFNFIGGHNDRDARPDRGTDRGDRRGAAPRRCRIWRSTAWGRGRRATRRCAALSPTRWRAGAASTAAPEDVLITQGSGQAIDLINQVLLEPGDTVILEEFTYGGYLTKLRRLGVTIVGAPLDEDGIRIDALAALLADLKRQGTTPKYICTIPTIQNPTGSIMPLDRRHQLLALAREYGVPIFEDECYADLTWGGMDAPPALYALDPSHVIHIGSFSKTLAPALRLGYVIADWQFMSRMVAIKTAGRQRYRGARTDGRRRVFLGAFPGPCRRAEPDPEGQARHDGRGGGARIRHRRRALGPEGRHLSVDEDCPTRSMCKSSCGPPSMPGSPSIPGRNGRAMATLPNRGSGYALAGHQGGDPRRASPHLPGSAMSRPASPSRAATSAMPPRARANEPAAASGALTG